MCKREIDNTLLNEKLLKEIEKGSTTHLNFLMEQWKTSVEFVKDLSIRRLSLNGFFLTGLSFLLSSTIYGDNVMNLSYTQYTILALMICIIGIVLCVLWVNQLNYYRDIIAVKYEVIRKIEEYLPARIFIYENNHFYNSNNMSRSFSKLEKRVPMVFGIIFLCIFVELGVPVLKMIIVKYL